MPRYAYGLEIRVFRQQLIFTYLDSLLAEGLSTVTFAWCVFGLKGLINIRRGHFGDIYASVSHGTETVGLEGKTK